MDAAAIRSKLIDQLLTISDVDYLQNLSKMIDQSGKEQSSVRLSEEQRLMLTMSDEDIKAERVIDQGVLRDRELQWLKGK